MNLPAATREDIIEAKARRALLVAAERFTEGDWFVAGEVVGAARALVAAEHQGRLPGAKNFAEYEAAAARTRGGLKYPNDLLNAALGLAGETGEVVDIAKKRVFHGVEDPPGQLLDELGDVLWYLAWLAAQHGATLEEVAARNIDKLQKRYPDGFETGGGRR